MGALDPEYWSYGDYREEELESISRIEQLSVLDSEIMYKELLPRYQGPVDSFEWRDLESHYNDLYRALIEQRLQSSGLPVDPVESVSEAAFHEFRKDVAALNRELPHVTGGGSVTISGPTERVLMKSLRQAGYNPDDLDMGHVRQGGGLYLLELFITAARQEATSDAEYLSLLLEITSQIGGLSPEDIMARLTEPVLMVSLWDNQVEGLNQWLDNQREGILEMATATGKTVAGIAAIAYLCGTLPDRPAHEPETDDATIMVVAHSNAILAQWDDAIRDKLGLATRAGAGDGRPDSLGFGTGRVEFYTAQSLLPQYDRNLADEYDLVIYDEVHHYSNESGYGAALDRPNAKARMGLSATIGGDDSLKRQQLEDLLAEVVYTYDVQDAQADGIIPDFEWTVHPTELDPFETEEWEKATNSITNKFNHIRNSQKTNRVLNRLSVPFSRMEDLGDFIQAHKAANIELDSSSIPNSWEELQDAIQSRTWIRHRSQPKIGAAVDLAREYLNGSEQGVKLVMFAMDIETTERIASELEDASGEVFLAHSQLANSSKKKDRLVREQIKGFSDTDHGVLIAPKLLDEGIDVPDAEVGINVAGTKTKLQLVQRMGRVLRKHGDQQPHFHHFVAIPDDHYLEGLDARSYAQELTWVRELGETIGQQPVIEPAAVDEAVLDRARERGNELWARELLADMEIESVHGSLDLTEILDGLTHGAAKTLRAVVDLGGDRVSEQDWETGMDELRERKDLTADALQRVWWLFPLYRQNPDELDQLLSRVVEEREPAENQLSSQSEDEEADESGERAQVQPTGSENSGASDQGGSKGSGLLDRLNPWS